MKKEINIDEILAPIPGENPAGENLRYTSIYDDINEARRADDELDRGDWEREIKRSDWDKVIEISTEALIKKTKDLQIAIWLTEALINTEGFSGFTFGLKIISSFLRDYWENLYPEIEEGDLDFRIGPLEFMNGKLSISIKQVSITDSNKTSGYSWINWQESRQVGYEKDTLNQYGDVDTKKKNAREELIAEGKLTAEDFDSAVDLTSRAYYESLMKDLKACLEEFKNFDVLVDEKFGDNPPRLAEIRTALDDCDQLLTRILKEKREREPTPEPEKEPQAEEISASREEVVEVEEEIQQSLPSGSFMAKHFSDAEAMEKAVWNEALKQLKARGIKSALAQLYEASCSMPSVRERNRYRLLMAKLCLKAKRSELARPIVEELFTLIEELHLERWESPMWVAEVLDALYQCLTAGTPSDEDLQRAKGLFNKICTIDVTKAMIYNKL